MTTQTDPMGSSCACHNITITGFSIVISEQCFGHCQFAKESPILQIHTGSIHVSNSTQLRFKMVGPHEVDIVCLECGTYLKVYASRRGAFCQLCEAPPIKKCGSYPSDALLGNLYTASMPTSMKQLFIYSQESADLFVPVDNENVNYITDCCNMNNSKGGTTEKNNQNNENNKGLKLEEFSNSRFRSKTSFVSDGDYDDNEDYDIMFSGQDEPTVGSYHGLGTFLTNCNHLVLAE